MNRKTKKISMIAVLCALSLVLGFVESLIPIPVPIIGVKLGLANIVIVVSIYTLGPKISLIVVIFKVVMLSLILGSPTMIAFSLCGSLFAWVSMALLYKIPKASVVLVSIVSATMHNLGQLLAAWAMLGTASVFFNLPIMLVAAVITGSIIGGLSLAVLKALKVRLPAVEQAKVTAGE